MQQLDPNLKDLINKGLDKTRYKHQKNFDKEQATIDQKMAKSVFS
jgi:hypothetical protein